MSLIIKIKKGGKMYNLFINVLYIPSFGPYEATELVWARLGPAFVADYRN